MMKKNKKCQSCAMPLYLHGEDVRGTEANEGFSNKYCMYCYHNGSYRDKEITFEEMLEIGKKGIVKDKGNIFVQLLMKWSYPFVLKKVERWQND